MVPEKLSVAGFEEKLQKENYPTTTAIPLGLSMSTTAVLGFRPSQHPVFLVTSVDEEQQVFFQRTLLSQISKDFMEVLLIDWNDSFEETLEGFPLPKKVGLLTDEKLAKEVVEGIIGYLTLAKKKEQGFPMVLLISDVEDFIEKTGLRVEDFVLSLKNTHKAGLHFILFGPHSYMNKGYEEVPKAIRSLKYGALVGTTPYHTDLIKAQGEHREAGLSLEEGYYVTRGGGLYDKIKLPKQEEEKTHDE